MKGALAVIVQDSTAALIAGRLREAVATGELPPGRQLREMALAHRLGVSRGPLREAMQRLIQEGLLVSHRNRGIFVMDLDQETIRDMYLAREAVERAALAHLVATGRHPGASVLVDLVAQMAAAGAHGDHPLVSTLDMRFHEGLVELSASPRLQRMHQTLLTQVRMCLTRMEGTYHRVQDRVAEHRDLARAVVAGQGELADALLVAHLKDGLERALRDAASAG